ncbi:MAG TPA: VIT1/CCC1 transporter family protein [Trebonia sp.]|nr:VIT1/CCC1 transporter family protein [Trebonia sp.]
MAGEETPGPVHPGRDAAALARWSHRHRDVSGGWLRPTVFGAVDGLVTNASLIAGVGGGGVSAHTVVLTGVALAAFSLGALIPLLPYLLGAPYLTVALGITAAALAAGGVAVGRITGRPLLRSGLRQLALGAVAVAVTYGVGTLIGAQAR